MQRAILIALVFVCVACGSGGEETAEAVPTPSHHQTTNLGLSAFSIQQKTFRCDAYLAAARLLPTINLPFVWETFGTSTACLDRALAESKFSVLETHLTNGTCDKEGRRCGSYEFKHGLSDGDLSFALMRHDRKVLARYHGYVKRFRDWIGNRLDSRVCIVSPMLEANISGGAGRVLIQETKKILGVRCLIVWNPRHPSQSKLGQDLTEVHGLTVAAPPDLYIANNDGEFRGSEELRDYLMRNRSAVLRFGWHPSFNCNKPGGFIDPRERDCSEQAQAFPAMGAILKAVFNAY